jgi:surface antigen
MYMHLGFSAIPLCVSAALVCDACATQPYPSTMSTPTVQVQAQSPPQSNCREFTAPVTVGGQPQQAVGQACQQPDGSWQITQDTPGLPPQVYTLPPQAIDAYPYPYPYSWADPWVFAPPFFAGGSIFFADGFHHFHDHDGFRHGRFHGGFHPGFHGGFRGGFHGGFAGHH